MVLPSKTTQCACEWANALRNRHRGTEFSNINEAMYRWYSLARQRNVPVSGPMLKEEALVLAV